MARAFPQSGSRPGFLLLEALVGIAVFAMFISVIGLTLLFGQENTIMAGDRARATYLAEEALEGVRAIRDASSSIMDLDAGLHGIWINPATGTWAFTGSSISSSGGYVTTIDVLPNADGSIQYITVETHWKRGYNRTGNVRLTTELTDWRKELTIGNWSAPSIEGSYIAADMPLFTNIALSGEYAFVTSDTSEEGRGLYVFDISDPSNPQHVDPFLHIGGTAYDLAVKGQRLYVLSANPSGEVWEFNISDPSSLSPGTDTVAIYNLPGDGRGRSMAIVGNTLLVGATQDVLQEELYAFDISNSGALVLQDSLEADTSLLALGVTGTSALLATSDDAGELMAARIDQPSTLTLPANEAFNVVDVQDGSAIAVSGTAAILGREQGEAIEELILFELKESGGFSPPPPGPWYHEAGGAIRGLDTDITGCLAFAATEFGGKEFQVVNIHNKLLPEVGFLDLSSGVSRGIVYDAARDRVLLITTSALYVLKPSAGASSCP